MAQNKAIELLARLASGGMEKSAANYWNAPGMSPMGGPMGNPMGTPYGILLRGAMGNPMGGPMGNPMGGPMGNPMGGQKFQLGRRTLTIPYGNLLWGTRISPYEANRMKKKLIDAGADPDSINLKWDPLGRAARKADKDRAARLAKYLQSRARIYDA